MASTLRRHRRTVDIWPGYVDALATLLIIIIFVLMAFVLSQFLLGHLLSGRTEALAHLNHQLQTLSNQLAMERKSNVELNTNVAGLTARLHTTDTERDSLVTRLSAQEVELINEKALFTKSNEQAALLGQQLESLTAELARMNESLGAAEKTTTEQKITIASLGERLNLALASKVEEMSRYRSEFFGRLRQILGKEAGVRIEGDRFVFQSEVLFTTGSAVLGEEGQRQLGRLATTLTELSRRIPPGINWILRVDGHTDRLRISNDRFASNWELSTARAISVVKFFNGQGIPPERLAATGFGEFQPIDPGDDDLARSHNRRIEIRLDQR